MLAILAGVKSELTAIAIGVSPMKNGVKHLFMNLSIIYMLRFLKLLFTFFFAQYKASVTFLLIFELFGAYV